MPNIIVTKPKQKKIVSSVPRAAIKHIKEPTTKILSKFPYKKMVNLKATKTSERYRIRSWFKENNVSTFDVFGLQADVMWDPKWSKFYFRDDAVALFFQISMS